MTEFQAVRIEAGHKKDGPEGKGPDEAEDQGHRDVLSGVEAPHDQQDRPPLPRSDKRDQAALGALADASRLKGRAEGIDTLQQLIVSEGTHTPSYEQEVFICDRENSTGS